MDNAGSAPSLKPSRKRSRNINCVRRMKTGCAAMRPKAALPTVVAGPTVLTVFCHAALCPALVLAERQLNRRRHHDLVRHIEEPDRVSRVSMSTGPG